MKKSTLFISFVFTLFLILNLGDSYAQRNKYYMRHMMYINNIRITGMVGLSSYYGDLCDKAECMRFRPGFTLGAYYRYNKRISLRGDLTYLRLVGNDKDGDNANRNLSFRSPNIELAGGVMYDLVPFERNYHIRSPFTPYLFLEVGMFYFNPRAEYNGKWYNLRGMQTEGVEYKNITMAIPFGGGIRFKINSVMDLSLEMAYRKTFTDYIDDVSTTYKENSSFSDPVAAGLADRTIEGGYKVTRSSDGGNHWVAGNQRGNSKRKDGYFLFGFKLEYMIKRTEQIHGINSMPRFRFKHK